MGHAPYRVPEEELTGNGVRKNCGRTRDCRENLKDSARSDRYFLVKARRLHGVKKSGRQKEEKKKRSCRPVLHEWNEEETECTPAL